MPTRRKRLRRNSCVDHSNGPRFGAAFLMAKAGDASELFAKEETPGLRAVVSCPAALSASETAPGGSFPVGPDRRAGRAQGIRKEQSRNCPCARAARRSAPTMTAVRLRLFRTCSRARLQTTQMRPKSGMGEKKRLCLGGKEGRVGGDAGLAQLAEQLICNQQVIGSSPIAGSIVFLRFSPDSVFCVTGGAGYVLGMAETERRRLATWRPRITKTAHGWSVDWWEGGRHR